MSLFERRVEAAALAMRDLHDRADGIIYFPSMACAALIAADAVAKRVDEAGSERQRCLGCGRYADECCLTPDERMARARAKGVEFVKEVDAVVTEEAHDEGMDAVDWEMVRDGVGDPQEAASIAVRAALEAYRKERKEQ